MSNLLADVIIDLAVGVFNMQGDLRTIGVVYDDRSRVNLRNKYFI
jgi:hypothetical protein